LPLGTRKQLRYCVLTTECCPSHSLKPEHERRYAGGSSSGISSGSVGVVFELLQGMMSRGASLNWISQYPFEQEILLPPLTGLELLSTRVDGGVLVVTCRPSINLANQPIEMVVSRRLKLLNDMAVGMQVELSAAAARSGMGMVSNQGIERFNKLLREGPLACDAQYYNDDESFACALRRMLDLKEEVRTSLILLPCHALVVDLSHSGWKLNVPERVHMLCLWLRSAPKTQSLDLTGCELTDDGGRLIAIALRDNSTLQTLRLTIEAVLPVQELRGLSTPMASLNLSRRRFGAVAGVVLSELVAINPSVEELNLSANMLGMRADAASYAIANAIRMAPLRLTTLNLADNYIGELGALTIADALAYNTILRIVDLSRNEVGSTGALRLAAKLKSTGCAIRRLCMQDNGVDRVTAARVASTLRAACPSLTTVQM